MSEKTLTPTGNRILASLSDKDRVEFLAHLEPFDLKHSAILCEIGDTIEQVYFINNGMISLVSYTEEGGTIEVGIVGYEGMAGLSVFLGLDESQYRLLVQGEGDAFRMKVAITGCGATPLHPGDVDPGHPIGHLQPLSRGRGPALPVAIAEPRLYEVKRASSYTGFPRHDARGTPPGCHHRRGHSS
jgi:hypothetical protein